MHLAELSNEELVTALESDRPVVPMASPEGRKIVASMRKGILHLCVRSALKQMRERVRAHSVKGVERHYEDAYATGPEQFLASFAERKKRLPYRLGGTVIDSASPVRAALVSRSRILAAISMLAPKSVCEVGYGSGQNLFYLASKLPDVRFSGYELTESGTKLARALQSRDLVNTEFGALLGLRPESRQAIANIRFEQGSAFALPCEDKSFDVVFTHSVLEQMHSNVASALGEIRRIARRYVVLHEPFWDANEGWGKLFLTCNNYFRLSSSDLTQHGLQPLQLLKRLPVKPTFAYGIVVAKII